MKNKNPKVIQLRNKIDELQKEFELVLKNSEFPYLDIFKKSTDAGEDVEKLSCEDIFQDLNRVTKEKYDQKTTKKKYDVETKLIRMMVKGKEEYYERALSITDMDKGYQQKSKKYGGNISTTTFQQIKPKKFNYLLGIILFKDGMDIFILPTEKISTMVKKRENGKAYLSGQHEGNHEEGQLNYNDKILNEHYVTSIYNDGKNLYHFNRENKVVGEIFTKLNFEEIVNEKFNI